MSAEIRDAIRRLTNTDLADTVCIVYAQVTSVDEDAYTCECEAIGGDTPTEFINVALMVGVNDGLLLIPKVGSSVMLVYSTRYQPFIAQYSEVERIEAHGSKIELNDSSYGGLVKVQELTEKLNNIENLLTNFIALYNLHVHAANGSPTVAQETGTLINTIRTDLENLTVTHGK